MVFVPIAILSFQLALLAGFAFFAFYNYLYGAAALGRTPIKRVAPSGKPVAIVVVSYNEEHVLPGTIESCENLTYPHRLIVLSDDSDDARILDQLRGLARARGCEQSSGQNPGVEVWESDSFVLFHRHSNEGYKGGNLRRIAEYLRKRGFEFMYLLDADWHPQPDAIERTLAVLEAHPEAAFVQTKRITFTNDISLFQKYVSLSEEGCYYVDFEGRQALQHPILFSGCCTLIRLDAVESVGGFAFGHLTEDLDVTNRLWLAGWQGVYEGSVVNYGEVPFTPHDFRRQQERWAYGTARCLREYFWSTVRSPLLSLTQKLAVIRQNAYFACTVLTTIAILQGIATVWWLNLAAGSFEVDYYLYLLSRGGWPLIAFVYLCIASNLVEPLVMIVVKKKQWSDLAHLPMAIWYAWSVLLSLAWGSVKGLAGINLDWFRTPKYLRQKVGKSHGPPLVTRLANILFFLSLLSFYWLEGWSFGWHDPFAILLIPAFFLGAIE